VQERQPNTGIIFHECTENFMIRLLQSVRLITEDYMNTVNGLEVCEDTKTHGNIFTAQFPIDREIIYSYLHIRG
jgi:hypothetical protein